MNCPKCNSELSTFQVDEMKLEQCTSCEGMWFDKDEIRQVKDKADSDLNWMDFEIWKHADKFKSGKHKYNCPKCNQKMEVLNYDETNIEIDYCKSCEGVWLDKGEIQKLIAALEDELLTKSFSEYVKKTLEEAKELITGPESFISEWKDFSIILRFLQYRFLTQYPKVADNLTKIQNNPFNR